MTDIDFEYDSPVFLANLLVVDLTKELRTKSNNDCSTFGRDLEELVLHASPLTTVRALGEAIGVAVSS